MRILTWLLQPPRARILPFAGQEAEHFWCDITNYTKGNAMGNGECHSLGTVPMAVLWPTQRPAHGPLWTTDGLLCLARQLEWKWVRPQVGHSCPQKNQYNLAQSKGILSTALKYA